MSMTWSKTKPTHRSCRAVTEVPIWQCAHMIFTSNTINVRNLKQWTFFQCRTRSNRSIVSLLRAIPIQQQKEWEASTFAASGPDGKQGNIQDSQN